MYAHLNNADHPPYSVYPTRQIHVNNTRSRRAFKGVPPHRMCTHATTKTFANGPDALEKQTYYTPTTGNE